MNTFYYFKDTKSTFWICLGFSILVFAFSYWKEDLQTSIILSAAMFAIIFPAIILSEVLGRKKHHSIIESKAFRELILSGFRVEEINDYKGLTGAYKNYIFDIYYDWNTYVRKSSQRAFVFNVYFKSPDLPQEALDDFFVSLEKKYKPGMWSNRNYIFVWRDGFVCMRNGIPLFSPSAAKIKEQMNKVIEVLIAENLSPIDRKRLTLLREEYPGYYIPDIETYNAT
jgi:hypothetical protein